MSVGKLQLFRASQNKKEYEKLRRTVVAGDKAGHLNATVINDTLSAEVAEAGKDKQQVTLIHDPSELRKRHSNGLECLGKVCDLDKSIINGYSSFNTIATFDDSQKVHLMRSTLYSNKEPAFLKVDTIKKLKKEEDFVGKEDAQKLHDTGNYINKKIIAKQCISETSSALKKMSCDIKIEHILDREFDDMECFTWLSADLNDQFIIRMKLSRTTQSLDSSQPAGKLMDHDFSHREVFNLQKVSIHNKAYQDIKLMIGWEKIGAYTVIKVELQDKKGQAIFKNPMLLLTNHEVNDASRARMIYLSYLKRWRIECVFKFIKSALGWESFRLHDFEGIKTLVALGFFIASYLYQVGEQKINGDCLAILAEIGGGKGVVSRHYIWEGIKNLLIKHKVDTAFERLKPDEDTIDNLNSIAGIAS